MEQNGYSYSGRGRGKYQSITEISTDLEETTITKVKYSEKCFLRE